MENRGWGKRMWHFENTPFLLQPTVSLPTLCQRITQYQHLGASRGMQKVHSMSKPSRPLHYIIQLSVMRHSWEIVGWIWLGSCTRGQPHWNQSIQDCNVALLGAQAKMRENTTFWNGLVHLDPNHHMIYTLVDKIMSLKENSVWAQWMINVTTHVYLNHFYCGASLI